MRMSNNATGIDTSFADWEREAAATQSGLANLLAHSSVSQGQSYGHTLSEILHQPLTWPETAAGLVARRSELLRLRETTDAVLLTGSGSSEYVGDCLGPALASELKRTALTCGGGWLLTEGATAVPGSAPLVISFARSGDSPESAGVLDLLLERAAAATRHLIITCNREGRLATQYKEHPAATVIVLDPRTNDRSLVMTSSFTNMALAARFLGFLDDPQAYEDAVTKLAIASRHILSTAFDGIDRLAQNPFRRAVYLGTGCRYGAAREASLKMLEMTAARVVTMAETYLGLRHGPMSFIDGETLVVCFLSADPVRRAYEMDLVREINSKGLGWRKMLVGARVPRELATEEDLIVEYGVPNGIADHDAPVLDVLAGQILAFHRCLDLGLSPDAPSSTGVITRVVGNFTIHKHNREAHE
ncbi:MAG: SIS domain-containing protein [Bryobacteraceae bacterium]